MEHVKNVWMVYLVAGAIFSLGGWCTLIRIKTGQNCKAITKINKETIPAVVKGLEDTLRKSKIEALEDKIMFIEFRKESKEATTADIVMLKQYVRRLESLRKVENT